MSRRPRRNHSRPLRRRLLWQPSRATEPSPMYFDVHPNQTTTWKSQLESSASEIFGPGGETPATPVVDVKSLHAKIGELTLENDS